jgi:hypothetical protein
VRQTLLSIHLLSAVVWPGAGLYDFLLTLKIALAAGQPAELPPIRIHFALWAGYRVAMFPVFIGSILMSALLGWGFFTSTWLGIKQFLMLAVLHPASPVRSAHREAC